MNIARLRAAAGEIALMPRAWISRAMGLTFDGKRDIYAALGYPGAISLQEFRTRYDRGDIAARIVEAPATSTWRGGVELIEDEDADIVTPFEQAMDDLDKKHNVWSTFKRADILAGIARYSVILLGARGELSTPLPRLNGSDGLLYLMPYSEEDAPINAEDYVLDTGDPRFGRPNFYQLARLKTRNNRVHWTRIIHVADGLLDDNLFAPPRLQRVWNRLLDLDKVAGGGAEAFWIRANQGIQFDVDPEIELDEIGEKKLEEQVEKYKHGMDRTMRTRGMTINTLSSDVADFQNPVASLISLISASTGIPQRILMGSERGELASSQDKLNWDERIMDRRTQFAGPFVVRQFVDRMIEFGGLPEPTEYETRWPENQNLDATQRMDLAVKATKANQQQGEIVITTNEIRDRILLLPPLEEVDPDAAARNEENAEADLELKKNPEPVADEDEDAEEEKPIAAEGREASTLHPIERAANRYRARFASGFVQTFARIQARINLSALERSLFTRDRDAVTSMLLVPLLDAQGDLTRVFAKALMDTLEAGGNAAARELRRRYRTDLRAAERGIGLVFDRTNPEAIRWVNAHGAELVTQVIDETRVAIRTALDRSFREGLSTKQTARILRDTVGLTDSQSDAVLNLRERLIESPGKIVKAGKTPIRVPKTGASQTLIDRATRQYSDRLLQKRAQLIARTETMTASNEGQRQLWKQAQSSGDLPRNAKFGVILSTSACPICAAMDGETRAMDSTYSGGLPPFHPRCTCTEGVTSL